MDEGVLAAVEQGQDHTQTGLDYDLIVDTSQMSPDECAMAVVSALGRRGLGVEHQLPPNFVVRDSCGAERFPSEQARAMVYCSPVEEVRMAPRPGFRELPGVRAWFGDADPADFGVTSYVGRHLDAEMTLVVSHLLWPRWLEIRGCVVREESADPDSIDHWLEHTGGDRTATEAVLNHLHLWDVFDDNEGDAARLLEALADLLVVTWRASLRHDFPGGTFVVSRDDDYGPGLVAFQER